MAKVGQMDAVKIMAKDLVRTRKAVKKFMLMKANIQAVSLKIQTLKSQNSMAQAMKGVTKAMMMMNKQMKLPEIQKIMQEFEKQSEIMDMKEEMMNDVMDDAMGDEDDEEETFQYYKDREADFMVSDYISQQNEITEAMRAILVDWLVEVQESFELNHETLYTTVKMTDIYLSRKQVRKEDLQLVGATACLIACKVDERIPPLVDDFLYVCDDAYNRDQLMKMERKMLKVVGFDLGYSLSYRYVRRYGRVCRVTMPVLTLARYILEMSLMEYKLNVDTSESKLAASCLILAMKMKGITGFTATMEYFSGYKLSELEHIFSDLVSLLEKPPGANLKTIRSKYSHKVFHEVATIPLPEGLTVQEEGEK